MKYRKIIFIMLVSCFIAFMINIESSAERGAFAVNSAGARPSIFGEAFVAVADDASAIKWNPAGLTQLLQPEFTSSHINLFSLGSYFDYSDTNSINADFIGFAMPNRIVPIGIGILNIGTSRMLISDETGAISNYYGSYSERTLTLSISKGFNIKGFGFSGGCNLNHYSVSGRSDSSGFGLDSGFLLKTPGIIPEIGLMMRGMLIDTTLGKDGVTIPARNDFAISFNPLRSIIISGGAGKTSGDSVTQYSTGLEIIYHGLSPIHISLIGGYKAFGSLEKGNMELSAGGFSVGASMRISRYRLDYAYEQHSVLGDTHRISLSILHNSPEKYHFKKGCKAFEQLDDTGAMKEFSEVIYLSPRDAETYLMMALTYERMREKEKAIQALNSIQSINYDYFVERRLAQLIKDIQEQE